MRASSSPRRPFHPPARSAALLAIAAAVLVAPLAVSAPASAHDQLISSDPGGDTTVEALPDEVTLTFSGELIDDGAGSTIIEVVSPSGADATGGDAEVNGAVVTQSLDGSAAEAGAYTVQWRVVSSDGHPIDGEFGFTVTGSGAAPSPSGSNPAASVPPNSSPPVTTTPPADDPVATNPSVLPWVIGGIILIALVVILVAILATRRRGGSPPEDGDSDGSDGR